MGRRGFTIVELLVSIVIAGVALIGVYYYYATVQYSMREQGRISQAQLDARLGLELLAADLQRAGYLATTNSDTDPSVCRNGPFRIHPVTHRAAHPDTRGPGSIYAAYAATPALQLPNATQNDNIQPDDVILAANYLNANEYLARTISAGGGWLILQELVDHGDPWNPAADGGTLVTPTDAHFAQLFPDNSLLRIVNRHGFAQFTRVTSSLGGTTLRLTLDPSPAQYSPSNLCGIEGWCEGCRVSVVTGVWYRIEGYAVDDPATAGVDERQKTDLVRYLVQPGGGMGSWVPVAGSREVVVEYAFDFQVWFRVMQAGMGPAGTLDLAQDAPPDEQVAIGAAVALDGTAAARPEAVRSAIVRLSVRSRLEDPKFPFTGPRATTPLERVKRFEVDPASEGAARVRTHVTEVEMLNIALQNQLGGP